MTTGIRGHFDRAGATYETAARVQRVVAVRLARLCPAVLSGRVLEIGAGSGLLTRELAPRLTPGSTAVALDLSPGMLAHAAMPQTLKLAADGEHPPFLPGTFDFLASASAMHWYTDPTASIAADLRLVRPGGAFAIALYVEGTLGELDAASRATGFGSIYPMRPTAFYRELFEMLPGVTAQLHEERHVVTYGSVNGLLRALKSAGVTHTPGGKVGSPARYREFVRYYESHFGGSDGVRAGYAVLYCLGSLATGIESVR